MCLLSSSCASNHIQLTCSFISLMLVTCYNSPVYILIPSRTTTTQMHSPACHPAHLSVVDHWKQRSPIPLTLPLAHLLNDPPWSPPFPCLYKKLSPTTDSLLANHILLGVYLPCFQLPPGLRLMLQLHVPLHAGE